MANQTGAMRGSCIRRLQSWQKIVDIGGIAVLGFSYREHCYLKQITKLEASQIYQNLHMSQSQVGRTTRNGDR